MTRRIRLTLAAVLLAALAVGGGVWYQTTRPYHFLTVTPGRLYRSGTLSPAHLEQIIAEHGIRTVVSLRTEGERQIGDWYPQERDICAANEVDLIHIPVDEPPKDEHIDQWLDLVRDEARLPILVHCKHGVVRTAVMVSLYEIEILGKDNAEVVEEVPLFGRDFDDPHRVHLREFLLEYEPRGPSQKNETAEQRPAVDSTP